MSPCVLSGTSPGGPFAGEGGPRESGRCRCPRQCGGAEAGWGGSAERVGRWEYRSPLKAVPATALGEPVRRT